MKVLYATDGFPAAYDAKRLLTKLLRRDGVEITVVTVTHRWSLDPEHLLLQLDPIEERRLQSQEIAEHPVAELEAAGFKVKTQLLEGHPGHEIVGLAEREDFDLVVVGAGGHSWIGNRLLGSVSTFVLHEAPCSVLVLHHLVKSDDEARVVVGVDGSKTSTETARHVAQILDPERCVVDIVSVAHLDTTVSMPAFLGPFVLDERSVKHQEEVLANEARAYVREAAAFFEEMGFTVTTRVEFGGEATVLLDVAREVKADMLVVGSRGLGPIRRVLLGSVSDQVARHAPAVLIGRFWLES
jgi:nucleotide-binding universal stress UspA family protein